MSQVDTSVPFDYLSSLQNSIDKLDKELIRLNADAINRRGSRKIDILNQIKNIEEALERKQQQLALLYNQPIMDNQNKNTIDDLSSYLDSGTQVAEQFGLSVKTDEDINNQDIDEVVVTGNKFMYYLDKYKFYIIGAVILIFIMFKRKK